MKVLIDTNVILDALVGRVPYSVSAEKLFLLVAEDKLSAFITASSVTDIYYLLRKYLHNENLSREVLLKLFNLFEVIEVTGSDCEKAMSIPIKDYEDALLATCARRKKLDFIITRNTKDFIGSPVKADEPDGFLTRYF
ncbi:PIN domain-containing protein [Desulfitobacterium sp. THU1]|uniref:PIN domain-containing protein n=1 Tax=Desulfitobacterium sp. THU1 TaxID=3138072 RepID=UPI00311EC542